MAKLKKCIGTKTKSGCGQLKPLDHFHVNKSGRINICRECTSVHKRAKYAAIRDDTVMTDIERLAICRKWTSARCTIVEKGTT